MSVHRFTKTKMPTPDDLDCRYADQYRVERRKALPWFIGIPVLLLGGLVTWSLASGVYVNLGMAILVVLIAAVAVWAAFGPPKPRKPDGKETRALLDILRRGRHD